jgi:hypothetical protein
MRSLRITPLRLAAALGVASLACTGVAYAAGFTVLSNKLFASTQTLTTGTCNQNYTTGDDTFVQQASPTSTAGGTAGTLTIGGAAGSRDIAFIRFDISGCGFPTTAGANTSNLKVYVETASTDTISLYPVYSSWSSSTLNWNGVAGLTIGAAATTTFTPNNTGSTTIEVTADTDAAIKAGVLWGWELVDTSGTATTVVDASVSTRSARRPSLTISYEE